MSKLREVHTSARFGPPKGLLSQHAAAGRQHNVGSLSTDPGHRHWPQKNYGVVKYLLLHVHIVLQVAESAPQGDGGHGSGGQKAEASCGSCGKNTARSGQQGAREAGARRDGVQGVRGVRMASGYLPGR